MSTDEAISSRKRPQPGSDSGRPCYPRKRAAQACRTCRKRRVKCDNERPSCSACIKLGVLCTYQEGDKSTFDAASIAILQRLDNLESLFRAAHPNILIQGEVEPQPSPDITPRSIDHANLAGPGRSEAYHINVEAVLEWPVLQPAAQDQPLGLASILQTNCPASDPSTGRLLATSDLDPDSTGPLLQRFVDNFHIYNPVFEIAQIQEYIKITLYNGLGWDVTSCISLLVFALGTIATDNDHSSTTSMTFRSSRQFQDAESFFLAAQRRMGQLLCNSDLTGAQVFFLAGVYLMSTMRPFEAWRMFVQALACCQILDSPSLDDPHNKESQLHKSIYWTSFKSELELRLELSITENSAWNLRYPQFFPAPPKGLQSEGEAGWYFYLAEIALRRLGNRILTYTCHFQLAHITVADKVSRVLEFEQQAQSWVDSLPQNLRLDHSFEGDGDDQSARLRFILNGHLLDCYEMMYWSFIIDAVHGTSLDNAEAIAFARKGFQTSVQRINDNESGFHRRHHGTWLMLRSCTRSALVLIAVARAGLENMLPAQWKSSIAKVKELLEYWQDEAADARVYSHLLEDLTHDGLYNDG
ncbi:hypothetical protein V3481_006665 [Fusarium oxysporum f. sp. vasinfectum]